MQNIPRIIVTGRKNEKDTIISDKPAQHVIQHESGFIVSDVWATQEIPVNSFVSKVITTDLL